MNNYCTMILLSLCLLLRPRAAQSKPLVPSAQEAAKLLSELKLSEKQKKGIRAELARVRKDLSLLKDQIEIEGMKLRSLLRKDAPDEKRVATLIRRVSGFEADSRTKRVLSWLRIRKQLSPHQRVRLSVESQVKNPFPFTDPTKVHNGKFGRSECVKCHKPSNVKSNRQRREEIRKGDQ